MQLYAWKPLHHDIQPLLCFILHCSNWCVSVCCRWLITSWMFLTCPGWRRDQRSHKKSWNLCPATWPCRYSNWSTREIKRLRYWDSHNNHCQADTGILLMIMNKLIYTFKICFKKLKQQSLLTAPYRMNMMQLVQLYVCNLYSSMV